MEKWNKEIKQAQLDIENDAYKKLKKTYQQALKDVQKKSKELQKKINELVKADPDNETLIRSKVYQLNYQKAIKEQLDRAMNVLNDTSTIEEYKEVMYKEGFISQFYAMQKQGVAVLAPINHDLMIEALNYDIDNIPLSKRLYDNVNKAKREILNELSRGIASGMSGVDVARNIQNRMNVSYRKARQLAQNEGHRVNTKAALDGMREAKKKGADIVKQWDCTYDGKTRPEHAELDQQWVEVDDYFEYSGGKVFAPKEFGVAHLDINCRCALLSVPRWDVEDTVQKRDNITGELIEAKNYADWKEKYHGKVEKDVKYSEKVYNVNEDKTVKPKSLNDYKDLGNASSTDHYFNSNGTPEWLDSLSDEQKEMIHLYTTSYYKNINNFNRHLGDWVDYEERIRAIEKYKDQFDSLLPLERQEGESMGAYFRRKKEALKDPIRKAKEDWTRVQELENANKNISESIKKYDLKDDIKLYRAVDSNAFGDVDLNDLVGTIYKDFSYMSTSPTLDSSYVNKDIIMELFVPKGMGRGSYIKDLSEFKNECEFLLEKGSRFEIKEVVTQGNKSIIRMEWLDNDG